MLLDILLSPGQTGLPNFVEWIGGMLGIAIVGVITRWQYVRGKKDVASPTTMPAEVAGAIIDNKKADEIVGALESLGLRMVDVASTVRGNTRSMNALRGSVEENTKASTSSGEQIEQARTDIRELTREIVRSSGGNQNRQT